MKDILVSYTRQEKDEAPGNYISVNHKGYIQHWYYCPTYTMAIIPSIEGKFHSVSIDKIWIEKEDIPPQNQRITLKSIEEIIKELTPIEKVQTLISMIDTSMGRRKYPKGIILLAQSLKEDYPTNP